MRMVIENERPPLCWQWNLIREMPLFDVEILILKFTFNMKLKYLTKNNFSGKKSLVKKGLCETFGIAKLNYAKFAIKTGNHEIKFHENFFPKQGKHFTCSMTSEKRKNGKENGSRKSMHLITIISKLLHKLWTWNFEQILILNMLKN